MMGQGFSRIGRRRRRRRKARSGRERNKCLKRKRKAGRDDNVLNGY